MAAISAARKAAFTILMAVERGKAHSGDLLHGEQLQALTAADRNLATALVLGVLRWQILLDEKIKSLLKRPGAKLDEEVRIALRLGAYQLLYLDRIPAHAAIDESVEMTKQSGHRFASGMVNAVLRGVARGERSRVENDEATWAQAHPAWMVERWTKFYGVEQCQAICRHGQMQPATILRIDEPAAAEELNAEGIRTEPGLLLTAARTVTAGDVAASATYRAGRVRIQDEGSQLIGEMAAYAGRKAGRILDACAAPGGKTLILAARNPEAEIVACEWSEKRLDALRSRLAAQAVRVECRQADAAALDEEAVYDFALADVPCSGTGTLGRNPEIRHRLQPEDLKRQAERQRAILRSVTRSLKAGGRVLYSTCSLEPEENEQVVAAALAEDAKLREIPLSGMLDAMQREGVVTETGTEILRKCLTPEGALRLLPGVAPTDGFFAALLEKAE